MEVFLISFGVVCIAAAIIGGGLSAAGFTIPVISSIPRQILLAVFGIALVALGNFHKSPSSIPETANKEPPSGSASPAPSKSDLPAIPPPTDRPPLARLEPAPDRPRDASPAEPRLTLRVFARDDLRDKVGQLRKVLPRDVHVQIGRSQVSPDAPIDMLLINQNVISPRDVLLILNALDQIGLPVRSVQSIRRAKNQEVQAGTIGAITGLPEQLDLNELRNLVGNRRAFWDAAENGYQCWPSENGPAICEPK